MCDLNTLFIQVQILGFPFNVNALCSFLQTDIHAHIQDVNVFTVTCEQDYCVLLC